MSLALVMLGVAASPSLAAPPANDARAAAGSLSPPGGVSGTTAESTLEEAEAPTVNGAAVSGSVWYAFRTPQARRVVLRFAAGGDLDAGVEVYRRARSQLPLEHSQLTGEDGRADFIFDSRAGATYFVRVAQRANSAPGGFRLDVFLPRLFPAVPGAALPKGGITGRVDGLENAADAFSAVLRPGVTYRVNLANLSSRRLVLSVFGPGTTSFQDDAAIRSGRSYMLLTPGVDEGGRYSFVVSASRVTSRQSYRLQVGRAQRDDQFPGTVLPNQRRVRGSLNARALDAVDIYRFDIVHRSTVAITLGTASDIAIDLQLRTASGRQVDRDTGSVGGASVRRTLQPGRYVLQVRARGASRGGYALLRVARTFTRLSIGGGGTVAPGAPVTLLLTLQPGESGPARVTIERFDPFAGWLFARRVPTTIVGGSGSIVFRPPTLGRWRARAEYLGSRTAEPSQTRRDVHFRADMPLEP
ncbi:MAG TPA: hypothetical protein VFN44_14210 [Solirubrobacteraceae bacterium]|nr:hypothetical protein [Solirubrobacteraceae bacterium]